MSAAMIPRLAVLAVLASVACGTPTPVIDAGPQAVSIAFDAKVGSAPFKCGSMFGGMGSTSVMAEPVDFRFYVHDVKLTDDKGATVALTLDEGPYQHAGTALLDFEDGTGRCTLGDTTLHTALIGTAPAGKFTGVSFKIGVPLEQNHDSVTASPAPLDKSSLFWSWKSGHVFFAATTRAMGPSKDGGTEQVANEHFTHVGSTGCSGDPAAGTPVTSCTKPNRATIALTAFDPATQKISVDFQKVKESVDITDNPGCHSFTAATCAGPFSRLGLDFDTGGASSSAQTVFKAE